MNLKKPYCLFIGDAKDPLSIKLAKGIADWRPEDAIAENSFPECSVTTGIVRMSIKEAAKSGAKTFVLGFANKGGTIDPLWIGPILKAIESGMDIASGLHQRLDSIQEIKKHAENYGVELLDVRHSKQSLETGNGNRRQGKRLLTVGTDCSVGKMYTSLAIEKALKNVGMSASFKATGQSGIFIAGEGIAVDCVISDFISGAVEMLSPDSQADHWDIIEGQGSLCHPAYAGVSLGLLHGAQPDALVLCHEPNREHMRGIPGRKLPSIEETIAINLRLARLTNPQSKFVAISLNTSKLTTDLAEDLCRSIGQQYDLPCFDPLRHGASAVLGNLT
jgi:D-glutamate N-acetyltransferase